MPVGSLLRIAWRNLVRHARHSAFALAAVAFGVAGLAIADGFIQDMFHQLGEATVRSELGHLQVTQAGFREEGAGRPEQFLMDDGEAVRAAILGDSRVDAVTGRIESSGVLTANGREVAAHVEGFEPQPRSAFGEFPILLQGSGLEGAPARVALLGEGVANTLGLAADDYVDLTAPTFDGSMNSFELRVRGVFRTFSKEFDERTVRIPLAEAQQLLQVDGVHALVVYLRNTIDTDAVLATLLESPALGGLEVQPWYRLSDFYASTRELYARQFGILRLIALVLISMSVLTSFNITVFERTAQLGTMRALGARSGTVVASIVLEAAFLGLIGAAIGIVLGVAGAALISAVGIQMPPPPNAESGFTARVLLMPDGLAWAAAIGFGSAVIGGLLPSLRVGRMPITVALGHRI